MEAMDAKYDVPGAGACRDELLMCGGGRIPYFRWQ